MRHRAQNMIGKWVVGWLLYSIVGTRNGEDYWGYRILDGHKYHSIIPSTLSIETGKLDTTGNMIFMSYEMNGLMTKGGDVVASHYGYEGNVVLKDSAMGIQWYKGANIDRHKYSQLCSAFNLTIIGKQSEVQSGN